MRSFARAVSASIVDPFQGDEVGNTELADMPSVGPGLVLILTISHATYFTNKSINHTPAT